MNENELIVVIAGDTSGLRAALTSANRELQQFTQTAQDVPILRTRPNGYG